MNSSIEWAAAPDVDDWPLQSAEAAVWRARSELSVLENPSEWQGVAARACADVSGETGRILATAAQAIDSAICLRRAARAVGSASSAVSG